MVFASRLALALLVVVVVTGTISGGPLVAISGASDDTYPFYVLVETRGSSEEHDKDKMLAFLQEASEPPEVTNAAPLSQCVVVAQSVRQAAELWFLRENITVALRRRGFTHKCVRACIQSVSHMRERYRVSVIASRHQQGIHEHPCLVSVGGVVDAAVSGQRRFLLGARETANSCNDLSVFGRCVASVPSGWTTRHIRKFCLNVRDAAVVLALRMDGPPTQGTTFPCGCRKCTNWWK